MTVIGTANLIIFCECNETIHLDLEYPATDNPNLIYKCHQCGRNIQVELSVYTFDGKASE